MIRFSPWVASCILVTSCATEPYIWKVEDVVGLKLALEDARNIEYFEFGPEGYVAATFGIKGGPVTGPLLHWKISGGRLQIGEGEFSEVLTLIDKTPSVIIAKRRSGEMVKYIVLKE